MSNQPEPENRIDAESEPVDRTAAALIQLAIQMKASDLFFLTNETETELLVNDNDTVVIGGIVKTTTSHDVDGLPFLTGIPILGNMLFGTTRKEDNRNELLIFLTPSIVQLEQRRNINQFDN